MSGEASTGDRKSKMDAFQTLQAGALGSRVTEFLEMKDKLALSRCNHHWSRVVGHPASWNESLVLDSKAIRGMTFTQLKLMLNRTQLQSLTLHINCHKVPQDKLIEFNDWLKQLARASDSKFKIKRLSLMMQRNTSIYLNEDLISSIPSWAKELESLRIDASNHHIHLNVIDDDGNVLKLHTLEMNGLLDSMDHVSLLEPTLRVLKMDRLYSSERHTFAPSLSKMHLTMFELKWYQLGTEERKLLYASLTEPLISSLTSVECSAWDWSVFSIFSNLEHCNIYKLSDLKEVQDQLPKLKRVTFHPSFSSKDKMMEIVNLSLSQHGKSNPMKLDIGFDWDWDARPFQDNCTNILKKIAETKGAKCVEVGENTFVIEPN